MAIAERTFPTNLINRLQEDSYREEPVKLLALKRSGSEIGGACTRACLDVKTTNDFIAAACPNGQLFAAVKKAQ